MNSNDLVVVIPGIMGSTLVRDKTEVWSVRPGALLGAIKTLGREIKSLELPDGIGDESPDDGVTAGALMPCMHHVPGIWSPVHGYDKMVDRLKSVGFSTEPREGLGAPNLILFPYDWRLSNRYTARLLKRRVEIALQQWRDAAIENRDAKVTFVCHSMGGLIARSYVYLEGGAEITNKIITLGTPYRGSVDALDKLVHGPMRLLSRIGIDFHQFARSLPSIYQLLPTYACVERSGDVDFLTDTSMPDLSGARVREALQFYKDIETAEDSNADSASRRHAIVGTKQVTGTTASLSSGAWQIHSTYKGEDLGGDGTVPAPSLPKNVRLSDNSLRRVADKHGSLQCNVAALDEIESVVTATRLIFKARASSDVQVNVPELVGSSDPLRVEVVCDEGPQPLVVSVKNELGFEVEQANLVARSGFACLEVPSLPPGGYTVEVGGPPMGRRVNPVSSPLLVWPETKN